MTTKPQANTLKPVELPKYANVPRWLVIQGEMDLRLFLLDKMLNKPRSAIEKMIDEATGFDKQLEKQALELIAECRWLKKEAEARESELRAEREANAKKEAEAHAEAKKIQDAKDAELRAEREKREAIEVKQREEAEADRRAKDAELEAERTAMLAPDKQKLVAFAKGLQIVRIEKLPAVKTNKAQELINYVDDELKRLAEYLIKEAKEL